MFVLKLSASNGVGLIVIARVPVSVVPTAVVGKVAFVWAMMIAMWDESATAVPVIKRVQLALVQPIRSVTRTVAVMSLMFVNRMMIASQVEFASRVVAKIHV